jgi:lipid A 4'-phosphatase
MNGWRLWAWIALVLVLAAFVAFPPLDLAPSAAFYAPDHGFPWRDSTTGLFVRHEVPRLILLSVAICVVLWVIGTILRQTIAGLTLRKIGYLLTTLVVGPGLVVETLLKPHSGRARPNEIILFGGHAPYTPPLFPAHACASNCSFVSGHAAVAFWLTAYAFIVPPEWRARMFVTGLAVGLAVGAVRVMQGAHFPSDIAYAGAIVIIVNVALARVFGLTRVETAHAAPDA